MATQVSSEIEDSASNVLSFQDNPPKSCTNFISTLPRKEGWSLPIYLYKNYWFKPGILEGILLVPEMFKPRHDDIVLATQPKCGTTWLKALTFAIINRSRYNFTDHPLLIQNPHSVVPFIEIPTEGRDLTYTEALPSPRLLSTHMPLSLLPPATTLGGSRIIYLCRDPKDAFVSRWHFEHKISRQEIGLDKPFAMFCEGFSHYGPFLDHCLEYWKKSLAKPDKILFMKYEEIVLDPEKVVRKIADFLGLPFSEEEDENDVVKEVVRLCSFEMLTSLEVNQKGGINHGTPLYVDNSVFFRKGKVGDWVNHMSKDMGEQLDHIVEEKLGGSGLSF